jgi:hypothetical protein
MSRPVAGVLLVTLATTLGTVAAGVAPTVANPAFAVSGPAPKVRAHPPLVQGVVADQFGHFVDDVDVEAVDANGEVAASSLTYASEREDGPQHGYFYLEVGRKGTYTLTLTRDGYKDATVEDVVVTSRRQRLALGEIDIVKKAAETRTSAGLDDDVVTPDERGRVEVSVSTKATGRPTGDVEVREGRTVVGTGELDASDRGRVMVLLKRLAPGSHHLTAYFLGSKSLKESASKEMTLTVKKPRRHH